MGGDRKRSETVLGVAVGLGGFALDRAVWAFHEIGVEFSPSVKVAIAYGVLLCLVAAAALLIHAGWLWLGEKDRAPKNYSGSITSFLQRNGFLDFMPSVSVTFYADKPPEFQKRPATAQGIIFFLFIVIVGAYGLVTILRAGMNAYERTKYGPDPIFFLPPKDDWRGRQFILPDVAVLSATFEEHTEDEAKRIIAPKIGAWVAVTGEIDDMQSRDSFPHPTEEVTLRGFFEDGPAVFLTFAGKWISRVDASYDKGYTVAAYCRLSNVAGKYVGLDTCELAAPPKS